MKQKLKLTNPNQTEKQIQTNSNNKNEQNPTNKKNRKPKSTKNHWLILTKKLFSIKFFFPLNAQSPNLGCQEAGIKDLSLIFCCILTSTLVFLPLLWTWVCAYENELQCRNFMAYCGTWPEQDQQCPS